MTETTALPTLFGRFTVISTEHERLSTTLREIAEMCSALEKGGGGLTPDSHARLLGALHLHLERHFAAEETEGYFGAVAQERPYLLPSIAELRAEHTGILETTAQLSAICAEESDWPQLAASVRRLIQRLQAHERAENRMLQDFFT